VQGCSPGFSTVDMSVSCRRLRMRSHAGIGSLDRLLRMPGSKCSSRRPPARNQPNRCMLVFFVLYQVYSQDK